MWLAVRKRSKKKIEGRQGTRASIDKLSILLSAKRRYLKVQPTEVEEVVEAGLELRGRELLKSRVDSFHNLHCLLQNIQRTLLHVK
jgi:hypothetical protein